MEIERPEWLDQMEAVLETLNEGVLISDDCHRFLSVNTNFQKMTGFKSAELIGRTPFQVYPAEDKDFIAERIEHGQRTGSNRFEFYVPQKNGGRLPVIISARNLEDPDGRQFGIVTFTDISEQKEAEARLKEANQKLEERQKEIEIELELAARVQQSLAPRSHRFGHVAVESFYQPVRTIGGDFGLVAMDDAGDHLHLMVCDVSGHGIGSALVANRIYSEANMLLEEHAELSEVLRKLNRLVLNQIRVGNLFFTMAVARLDASLQATFAGAGHPPAILLTAAGELRRLASRSLPLGALEYAVPDEPVETVQLERGDRLVIYSDGLTDVFDAQGEMLGVEGLEDIVRRAARQPLAKMKNTILQQVESWGEGPLTDDVSLLVAEAL